MNMRDRDYTWYVKPFDSHTNLAVSMQLPEENFGQFICQGGKSHNLWRCSFEQAKAFWRSRESLGLALDIYTQEGIGEIRFCNFLFKKKKSKTAG